MRTSFLAVGGITKKKKKNACKKTVIASVQAGV